MKRTATTIVATALVALAGCAPEPAQEQERAPSSATFFSGMTLITGDDRGPIEDAGLLVEDGSVVAVGPVETLEVPQGASTVDLSGRAVMPTIHSLHTHLGYLGGSNTMKAENYSRESVLADLERHAYYGVSVVLALGTDPGETAFRIREDQAAGRVGGARLYTAGRGITAKGGWPTTIAALADVPQQVGTEEEAREAVRALAAQKVDVVKIWIDDAGGTLPKLAPELYRAVIDEAKKNDLATMAHVFYLEDAKSLVEAGIDGLAHSIRDREVDDELVEMMRGRDVFYVPTLSAHQASVAYADENPWIEETVLTETLDHTVVEELTSDEFVASQRASSGLKAAREQYRIAVANAKRLGEAGIRIAVGTDSGTTNRFPGFFEHREMELLVDAGLSPEEAIASATRIPAAILDTNGGILAPGRMASFLVLDRNPLEDITATRDIADVYLAGEKLDRESIRSRLKGATSD